MSLDYYVPSQRVELLKWLEKRYPEDKTKLRKMTKKRLYAIYFSVRDKKGGYLCLHRTKEWTRSICLQLKE